MINFLCASDSENLDSVLRYNPICYSMKKSMHEHELVNLNDSSSVSNETKITTAIPTFFFTSDKKSLNYHGQTLVLNCPMPKKQVDFVIKMIHWVENDTSTNIINGKEYVSSENGEKIYVFELNRPQKKRQSPTPKQWAIIGGSIGAGILAAIGGGMLYSNLKNAAKNSANLEKLEENIQFLKNREASLLSGKEINKIKGKMENLPKTKDEFIAKLKGESQALKPTEKETQFILELRERVQNFNEGDEQAFKEAVQMVKDEYPGASENQILAELYASMNNRNVEKGYLPTYNKLEGTGASDSQILNKYNNVLTLFDDTPKEQKIIYILNDLLEEGKENPGTLLVQIEERGKFNDMMQEDDVSTLMDLLDVKLIHEGITEEKSGDVYQTIIDGDLNDYKQEIDQAREMLKQMDATQGDIDETVKVNRSDTRVQEYETKLESGMTQQQIENLEKDVEQDVEEGGEKLVTDIEDYAGKIAEGTI